jgi:hypothetical protein
MSGPEELLRNIEESREVSVDADPKLGPGGWESRPEPPENDEKPRKPTETQRPCPGLRGTCIRAFAVCTFSLCRGLPDLIWRSAQGGAGNRRFGGLNGPSLPQNLSEKVEAPPPPFPVDLAAGGGRLDSPNLSISGPAK